MRRTVARAFDVPTDATGFNEKARSQVALGATRIGPW